MRALFLWLVASLSVGAANLIPNSSFECGGGRGLFIIKSTANEEDFRVDELISTNQFQHGAKSLQLFAGYEAFVRPLRLDFLQAYKWTFYAKASATVTLHCHQFNWGDGSISAPDNTDKVITTSWQRFEIDVIGSGDGGDHYLSWTHDSSANIVYIDSVQLEPTTATSYAPMAQVECGIATTNSNNIFTSDGPAGFQLRFWNDGSTATSIVAYEVRDTWNRLVKAAFVTNSLPAGTNYTNNVALPVSTNGFFRIITRLVDSSQAGVDSRDELPIAILPFAARGSSAPPLLTDTNGSFGIHPDADRLAFRNVLRKSGVTWARTLSPLTESRWNQLQASEGGAFNWTTLDAKLTRFATNGLVPLYTLTADDASPPSWTTNVGGIIEAKFIPGYSNYVWQVVNRYCLGNNPWNIEYFEFLNEPHTWCENTRLNFCDTNYVANLMIMVMDIVKDRCPTCKFVAMGGMRDADFAKRVYQLLDEFQKANVDAVSMHLYVKSDSNAGVSPMGSETQSEPSQWRNEFGPGADDVPAEGIPIMNTELGAFDWRAMLTDVWTSSFGNTVGWDEWQRGQEVLQALQGNVERVVQTTTRCMGNGFKRVFHYDGRSFGLPNITPSGHSSIFQSTKSLQPKAVALAVLSGFIDGYAISGQITNTSSSAVEMYYFNVASSSNVVVAWANDRTARLLTVTNDFTVYDTMGNQLAQSAGKLAIGRAPVYIVTTSASSNTIAQTLRFASVATLTDTNGPSISVDYAPSGNWISGSWRRFKWTFIDDTYINNTNTLTQATNIDSAWHFDNDSYGPWSQTNFIQNISLSAGGHTLWVKARDRAGNTSEVSYVFAPTAPPAPPVTYDGKLANRPGKRQPLGGFP